MDELHPSRRALLSMPIAIAEAKNPSAILPGESDEMLGLLLRYWHLQQSIQKAMSDALSIAAKNPSDELYAEKVERELGSLNLQQFVRGLNDVSQEIERFLSPSAASRE